jgi:hypothetical protein
MSSTAYKVFKIDGNGKGTILATITDAPAAYIHTTFATERFVGQLLQFPRTRSCLYVSPEQFSLSGKRISR